MPTILISFVIPKSQYSYERIRSMECISKAEVAKLKEVRYGKDIQRDFDLLNPLNNIMAARKVEHSGKPKKQ